AAVSAPRGFDIAFGFVDGSVRLGHVGFASSFLKDKDTPPALRELPAGKSVECKGGVVSRTPAGQLRLQQFKAEFDDPIKPEGEPSAVVLIDRSDSVGGTVISAMTADGRLRTSSVTRRRNPITDEDTIEVTSGELAIP